MKAIQITNRVKLKVIEKEMPVAKQGEALLKVLYCGICGADVASYTGNQSLYHIMPTNTPVTSFRHQNC